MILIRLLAHLEVLFDLVVRQSLIQTDTWQSLEIASVVQDIFLVGEFEVDTWVVEGWVFDKLVVLEVVVNLSLIHLVLGSPSLILLALDILSHFLPVFDTL